MNPHDDLSLENMRAFLASALVAAAVALGFIAYLFWSLSAVAFEALGVIIPENDGDLFHHPV